jgi:hypothetical protein
MTVDRVQLRERATMIRRHATDGYDYAYGDSGDAAADAAWLATEILALLDEDEGVA